jgi:hypothetical protein
MIAIVKDDHAYLALRFGSCLSYQEYGKPLPPYVFMKHQGDKWRRIPIEEFPPYPSKANLLVDVSHPATESGWVTAQNVAGWNDHLKPDSREIQRSPPWWIVSVCPY